jgi:hypothetical protein
MKKVILITISVFFTINTVFASNLPAIKVFSDTAKKVKPAKVLYTCKMHPEILREKPGKCPKCGMTLVKKEPAKKKPVK